MVTALLRSYAPLVPHPPTLRGAAKGGGHTDGHALTPRPHLLKLPCAFLLLLAELLVPASLPCRRPAPARPSPIHTCTGTTPLQPTIPHTPTPLSFPSPIPPWGGGSIPQLVHHCGPSWKDRVLDLGLLHALVLCLDHSLLHRRYISTQILHLHVAHHHLILRRQRAKADVIHKGKDP